MSRTIQFQKILVAYSVYDHNTVFGDELATVREVVGVNMRRSEPEGISAAFNLLHNL